MSPVLSRPSHRSISALAWVLALGALPLTAQAQEAADQQSFTDQDESRGSDIVVLGTRSTVDRTQSSDRVTERMSQSSRSIERDILDAAGTYRLSDALELDHRRGRAAPARRAAVAARCGI